MKKTIEVDICDLCKEKKETQIVKIPVYRTFDSNDGKIFYSDKHFEQATLDLCDECLDKVTLIHSVGVCYEEYELGE